MKIDYLGIALDLACAILMLAAIVIAPHYHHHDVTASHCADIKCHELFARQIPYLD